jgi:NitT/TauT family transport system ATP-binding protein
MISAQALGYAPQPHIAVQHVNLSYRNDKTAQALQVLSNINLQIEPGEFVSIVGPSGCGKSTLLRILAGLLQPTSGKVLLDGQPIDQSSQRTGFMFQRDTLLPWATVEENICIGLELSGKSKHDALHSVAQWIGFLHLEGFERHLPHQISGGMRQRVALGRLLAYEPDIYLMDEPFGALDSQTKILMGRELLRVWELHKKSVVFVTHDIDEAVSLSDRVVVLSSRPGQIQLDLKIELRRPRDRMQLRHEARFSRYVEEIWHMLNIDEQLLA